MPTDFWLFVAFDFGVLPTFSDYFWGVIGTVLAILGFGFTYKEAKSLNMLFPAFSKEEVYGMADWLYIRVFWLSCSLLLVIVSYFITKVIFWALRCLGEAMDWQGLVAFTHISPYGFAVMCLLVAALFFYIYFLNRRKLKQASDDKGGRDYSDEEHFQSVL